ncbi:multiple inositol polyphosphate phosphatase 1-like [Periplaneta americana]|uniref:multiple inositol polyphosphate phosphatase 1-like n=1 Tax=Periplaneta americana TaxID=6978 RepID=UPI0037E98336
MVVFLFWIIQLAALVAGQGLDQCYANVSDPYLMFATGTAYELIYDKRTSPVSIEQCEPQQFWLISRHGTRYPPSDGIASLQTLSNLRDNIIQNHEIAKRGRLCEEDLENLKEWTLQVLTTLTSDLTVQGYNDLHKMAQRYKERFPTLLNHSYSKDLFEFRFANSQRTTASGFAFVDGLFGTSTRVNLPEPLDDDQLIKPYDTCQKWKREVDENPDTVKEMYDFQDGDIMASLLQNVSLRLGFNTTITIDNVNAMYDGCRFDKAWHVQEISPWCAMFSEEELKVMEYREDLLYYYYAGYGMDLNKQVGCPPVKDFLDRFSQIENGSPQPAGVFYFTHSEMLQMILLPLGIAQDEEPLTHSNYEQMRNRLWKTSYITPFAINLAVVLFRCDAQEQYKVQFYLGENLLYFEGCDQGLCDWSYIKKEFGSISTTCNLDFCSM